MSEIVGFDQVVRHFGEWPSFHDAIVDRFTLDLQNISLMSLRTWNTSATVDERGYFRTTDHATVDFVLAQISAFELSGSDLYAGSILFGLRLAYEADGFRLELDPSLGAGGWICCKDVRLELRSIEKNNSLH
jgi:hypothetical protein